MPCISKSVSLGCNDCSCTATPVVFRKFIKGLLNLLRVASEVGIEGHKPQIQDGPVWQGTRVALMPASAALDRGDSVLLSAAERSQQEGETAWHG